MKKALFLLIIWTAPLSASSLLNMDPLDARSFGLGQSCVASPGFAISLSVNPAFLAGRTDPMMQVLFMPWFETMNCYSLEISYPVFYGDRPGGSFAAGVSVFAMDPFPNYDMTGLKLADLNASDVLITAGYGFPVFRSLALGGTIKFFNPRLGDAATFSACADVGVTAGLTVPGFQRNAIRNNLILGMAVQNLGLAEDYGQTASPLPVKFRSGLSYCFLKAGRSSAGLMAEANVTTGLPFRSSVGLELNSDDFIRLRLGYVLSGKTAVKFTAGAGIGYRFRDFGFSMDYAFLPTAELGVKNVFSISMTLIRKNKQGDKS